MNARVALVGLFLASVFQALRWILLVSATKVARRVFLAVFVVAASFVLSMAPASAEEVPTRFVNSVQLTNSLVTYYTVPAGKIAVVQSLSVCNYAAAGAPSSSVYINPGLQGLAGRAQPANHCDVLATSMPMVAGESIAAAVAGVGTSVYLMAGGTLYDAGESVDTVAVANFPPSQPVTFSGDVQLAEPVTVEPGEGTSWGTTSFDFANVEGELPVEASNSVLSDEFGFAVAVAIGLGTGILFFKLVFARGLSPEEA